MDSALIYKNLSLENLEGETWRAVVGYEGLYEVSSLGRVKIVKRKKIKAQSVSKGGYLCFTIYKNNKNKYVPVHRLVAESFIPNPESKSQVNHKKGIKTDNRATELEWNTCSENQLHSFYVLKNQSALINIKKTYQYTTKLKEKEIKYILEKRASGVSAIEIAKELNVVVGSITRVIKLNNGKFGIVVPDNLPRVSHQTKEESRISHIKANAKKAKAVLLFDINNNFIKRFDSKRELIREYNLNRGSVSRCCKGLIKQHKGYVIKNEN